MLWSNLTGNMTIVGTTSGRSFGRVFVASGSAEQDCAEGGEAGRLVACRTAYLDDEIFNSDDDVTLGMNPVFAAWSGSYPDNWSNWVGGAPTKETSIVRVGSNAVRMTASIGSRIQCDTISFTSTPSRLARFSGAVDFYLAARTLACPASKIRLYTNSAKSTLSIPMRGQERRPGHGSAFRGPPGSARRSGYTASAFMRWRAIAASQAGRSPAM